jgi:hypothetical protein
MSVPEESLSDNDDRPAWIKFPHGGRLDRHHIGATLSPCQMESVMRCHVDATCVSGIEVENPRTLEGHNFHSRAQF